MIFNPVDYDQWRDTARRLIAAKTHPSDVVWTDSDLRQPSLFSHEPPPQINSAEDLPAASKPFNVPKRFLELAPMVAAHRSGMRWEYLYRTLFRITHQQPHLMQISTDDDVHQLEQMQKAVRRDIHKMKAFVRFRLVTGDDPAADLESAECSDHYIAWHRPDHRIVKLASPFFARRFAGMRWTILTPDASASWDGQTLSYGAGADVTEAPSGDELEELWRTYYASIFNPARIKIKAMKTEMPVRHWPTLPESRLIPDLLLNADSRVSEMIARTEGFSDTAAQYLPIEGGIPELAAVAESCTACPLHEPATQTVFGRGPESARIVLVGEQPGDREDSQGEPFVGPAGQLLDEVMLAAGMSRNEIYITNVVKHFKFVPKGKRRIHQKPNSREIFACRPWLEAELERVQPQTLVCLGATAAQALLGRDFRITKSRGQIIHSEWCDRTMATWHPAAILRMPDAERREAMKQEMIEDILLANSSNL